MTRIPLYVVAGPTASGKTDRAVALALRLDGEVVGADSMQLYAGMPIGTAQPTGAERRGVPHHLIGVLSPAEVCSVARYVGLAHAAIADIAARGKTPILCGGTGLYIRAVCENWQFQAETQDDGLRELLRRRAASEGGGALLAELAAIDPETAARLHPRDVGRIVRALELAGRTGVTMSEQVRQSRGAALYDVDFTRLEFRDRAALYRRIDARVDGMLAAGLLEEARAVLGGANAARSTALQAIGYKELAPYLAGTVSLEEAVEGLKRGTRRYAKRQLTWFRRVEGARTVWVDEETEVACC